MTACRYLELVEELADGSLAPDAAREVRAHLDGCAPCRQRHDATTRLVAAAAALPELEPPPDLFARALAAADLPPPRPTGALAWLARAARSARPHLVPVGLTGALAATLALFAWQRGTPSPAAAPTMAPLVHERELGTSAIEAAAAAPRAYEDALGELAPLVADARRGWTPTDAARIDRALASAAWELERVRRVAASRPGDLAAAQAVDEALAARVRLEQAALLAPESAALDVRASLAPEARP